MARIGGNPDLGEYRFKSPAGRESNNKHLQLMVSESMLLKLKSIPKWQDLVREAIATALDNFSDQDVPPSPGVGGGRE